MHQIQYKENQQVQLTEEINALKEEVEYVKSQVEEQYKAYEDCKLLGNAVKEETKNHIIEAQNNMKAFLSEALERHALNDVLSISANVNSKQIASKQWHVAAETVFNLDTIAVVEEDDFENTIILLEENLQDCCEDIKADAATVLAEVVGYNVLYKQDLLLLGMNSVEIAQMIALTFTGQMAPVISCFGEENWDVLTYIKDSPIVIVKNALESSWKTQAPIVLGQEKAKHCFIWVEEFEDSLIMEARDILNYVTPIFLNAFLSPDVYFDNFRRLDTSLNVKHNAKNSSKWKLDKRIYKKVEKTFNWKQFGGSQFYCKRITGVISHLVNEFSERESAEVVSNIGALIGILPLAMIGSRQEKLSDCLKHESISPWVREILEDYAEKV